jgi:LPS-assembly lipoprotein
MRALAALIPALLLAGCGFTPLYGQPGVAQTLSGIDVHAPEGRTGHLIREHLDDALAAHNGAAPSYRMDLALTETRYPRGIRIDNVATRYEYVLVAEYTVRALPSLTPLKNGRTRVTLTYDSADQPYASVAAQQVNDAV